MTDALERRQNEHARLVDTARLYVQSLEDRLDVIAAVIGGSVARGDFNVWSDIDVVIVASVLPDRLPDRLALLSEDAPAGVQPAGFTPAELLIAVRRKNRLVLEAVERGIPLRGDLRTLIELFEPRHG